MKQILIIFLIVFLSKPGICRKVIVPENVTDVKQWVDQHFAKGKIPPFSFVYGGKSSDTFIKNWKFSAKKIKSDEILTEKIIYTYSEPDGGLSVRCSVVLFNDFPAVEWVLKFSNSSGENTPVIEKEAVIDYSFTAIKEGEFILHHNRGSNAKRSDFQPIDEKMQEEKSIYLTPAGGRSSDNTAFPFFNIEMPAGQGVVVAVGWTGKWYANMVQKDGRTMNLKSGMERIKLRLLPKEEIRSPKICLLFWKGSDRMVGHNQFRQFILAHHTRKINGKNIELPLSVFLAREGPSPCNEHTCATESFSVAMIYRHKQFDIVPEVFWLDAGWYPCMGIWSNVGNWTPNTKNFPNGLKPVTDAAHNVGAKFLLWFEPERVTPGTQFANKNPDWLLKVPGNSTSLFNLGNEKARIWLTDYISAFIEKEGIDYYRQDFNMEPMPYWKENDKIDRIGISEIRHIEGLYAYWDSLLVRFPDILIDNCASGGRRIDLETISRSSPLWRSDYNYTEPNGKQCHTYGLNFYLPLHGTGCFKASPYNFRSAMSSSMVINWDINSKKYKQTELQKYFQDFKRLRLFYYEDYFPLTTTDHMTEDNVWLAYQLNRPEQGDGIIMAFRRENCPDNSIQVKLKGIDKDAFYELYDEDTNVKMIKKGKELLNGIVLSLDKKCTSLLISYKQKTDNKAEMNAGKH